MTENRLKYELTINKAQMCIIHIQMLLIRCLFMIYESYSFTTVSTLFLGIPFLIQHLIFQSCIAHNWNDFTIWTQISLHHSSQFYRLQHKVVMLNCWFIFKKVGRYLMISLSAIISIHSFNTSIQFTINVIK